MKVVIPLLILMSLLITEAVAQNTLPGSPTGLTATSGDRQVHLKWKAPSNTGGSAIRYYRIGYKPPASTAFSDLPTRVQGHFRPVTSWTISMPMNSGTFSFRVAAVNHTGTGPPSETIEVAPAIPAPKSFSATPGDGQVTLRWTPPSPVAAAITGYEYSQDGEAWESAGTGTSHLVILLDNGVPYAFRVQAVRGTETTTPSRTVTVTPLTNAPRAPGTLNVERNEDTATLTWSPPSDTGERITRYEYSEDGGSTWHSTGSTDPTYTVTGLEAGETYTFLVRAIYVDGKTSRIISPRSTSSNAAVLTLPNPKRRIIQDCPVGWVRSDGFAGRTRRVLIYEVKLDMDLHNPVSIYKPDWVAIYVHPDEALENLEGWKLQVALPYNHHSEYLLTAENSVIVDSRIEGVEGGFAFIENPEESPFPMTGMGFTGSPAPGFDYRLYDETGRRVDFGIACYKRFDVFQVLNEMEDPRVLRKVLLESFDWDQWFLRSEWTVPMPAPAAPSLVKKSVVGTWAALKKQ